MKVLAWLGSRSTGMLAIGAALGLLLPGLAEALHRFLPILVFLFTATSFVKVEGTTFAESWRQPLIPCLLIFWVLLACPVIFALLIELTPLAIPTELKRAILVWAASPPMTAAIIFAIFLGLHLPLAVGVAIIGTLVLPATGPAICLSLGNVPVQMDSFSFSLRVGVFIASAALFGWAVRRVLGKERLRLFSGEISGVIVVVLMLYAASLTAAVNAYLQTSPAQVAIYIGVAYAINIFVQLVTAGLFAWAGRLKAVTGALLAGNRNMSVLTANLGGAATPEVMLFFAAVHVPIYTLPWVLRYIYGWAASKAETSV